MEKEIIATGSTYEEALVKACQQLGVERSDVEYEVLERPKTSLFGLKKIPAKIKVILTDEYLFKFAPKEEPRKPERKPEQKPQQRPERPQEAPQQRSAPATAPEQKREPRPEQKPAQPAAAAATAAEKPQQRQERMPQQERPQRRPEKPDRPQAAERQAPPANYPPRKAAPRPEAGQNPAEFDSDAMPKQDEPKELSPEVLEQKGSASAAYLKEILGAFGYPDTEITYTQKDGTIVLQLLGESLGSVVGRRGDNLDAMQYLASLVANRSEGAYVRVVLDVDDYRSKREASLQAYARKTANQAIRAGRSITLEAMNPYERRIVHSAVQTVEGATSKSIGSEPNRRVVISPVEGARPQPDRGGDRGYDHGGDRRGGRSGDRPVEHTVDRPIEHAVDHTVDRPIEHAIDRTVDHAVDRPAEHAGDRGGDRGGDRRGGGGRGGRRDGGRDRRESQRVIVPPSDEPKKDDTSAISLYGRINLD